LSCPGDEKPIRFKNGEKGLKMEYQSSSHVSGNNRRIGKVSIIIEHLEPVLGKWIWLEYTHVSNIVGCKNLLFTNVRKRAEAIKLKEIGKVTRISIMNMRQNQNRSTIILDPQATDPLSPVDFHDNTCLIIGGILGDHPASGKTKRILTDNMPFLLSRNLGHDQFSVDGAVHVAMQIASGKSIADIPVKIGVEIAVNKRVSSFLPFAYPTVKGKPLLAPGLREYLRKEVYKDEEILFKTGMPRSVAKG